MVAHTNDVLKLNLIAALGGGIDLALEDLWMRYMVSLGYTTGTLLDRQAKAAVAAGIPLYRYVTYGPVGTSLGSEMVPAANSGSWSLGANQTQDGTGLHYTSANNLSVSTFNTATENSAFYRVGITVANYVGGSLRVLIYGASTPWIAATSPNITANGVYSYDVQVVSAAGSASNSIRIQCTGTSGTNTYDVTAISVRKIL